MRNPLRDGTRQKGQNPVNAMTRDDLPTAMRASDADRDAVVSDLGEHFQAGRLTAAELDERTGRALAARTWGELGELLADIPAARPAAAQSSGARPGAPARRGAPPLIAPLAGIGIAAAVLVNVAHGSWGFIWLLLPVLIIARRLTCHPGGPRHCGQQD